MLYQWHIIGHENQLLKLEEEIKNNNLAESYLFSGPAAIGKFTVAKTLAAILQCPDNFCRKCSTCYQIEKSAHLDVLELQDDGESIKIEQIREIINRLSMTGQSKYKIILIENIERMTLEAANCLLKTLEEPSPHTIFLLTTDNQQEVIPTIISRTRIIQFNSLSEPELYIKLKEFYRDTSEETIKAAVSFSGGQPAEAIMLIKNTDLLSSYQKIYNTLARFLEENNITKRFLFIDQISQEKNNVYLVLKLFTHLIRAMMLEKSLDTNASSHNLSLQNLIFLLQEIDKTIDMIKRNINIKLSLENLMLKF